MSKSIVARLRECIEYHALGLHPSYGPPSTLTHIERDTLSVLLDIVEAMAAKEPLWINDEFDAGGCIYCDGAVWNNSGIDGYGPECTEENKPPHAPNCPHIRARELCGMEQDGAE